MGLQKRYIDEGLVKNLIKRRNMICEQPQIYHSFMCFSWFHSNCPHILTFEK